MDDRDGRTRRRTATAYALLGLAALQVTVGAVALAAAGVSAADVVRYDMVVDMAVGLAYPVCGTVIALHRPRNPIGWLLIAYGLGHAFTGLSIGLAVQGLRLGWSPELLHALTTIGRHTWIVGSSTAFVLVFFLFPDGRLPDRRWRWALVAQLLSSPLDFAIWARDDWGLYRGTPAQPSYLPVPDGWMPALRDIETAKACLVLAAVFAVMSVRYRRGGEQDRRRLLWLIAGMLPLALSVALQILGFPAVYTSCCTLFLPTAIMIAVVREELLDIRLVVSRSLLYGALTVGVATTYVGLVTSVQALLNPDPALLGPALIAVTLALGFEPARRLLQRTVDHALYGDRHDPVRAVSRIGERLAGTGVGAVPEAVGEALRLPYVCVESKSGVTDGSWGEPGEHIHAIPLDYDGRTVGALVIGLRPGEQQPATADLAVLELLAVPLAAALHAIDLTRQLQLSRERIVAAREEERRRIRRDLHDGLGPTLAGAAFQADAVRNLLTFDPDRAAALLTELRSEVGGAVAEVRRLVDGLRPPDLDQLGLLGALRERAVRLSWRADGTEIQVRVRAPERLPALPAAVEVAAYRIAIEALTNAARHARASHVDLHIEIGEGLRLEVCDDGSPVDEETAWTPGVGITSMQERAAELGGRCVAGQGRVVATLPLGEAM
ncbi:histidine kinase [Streptomyces sp. NBC_00988]|uniref:sensor histidine kinase n=1 Tax=Streptomyces sp. NBC_00988 TaxID=2903704 RepID=UPI00386C4BFB|nr:histidine kinase [Streptomyces sp. NBC_00988]